MTHKIGSIERVCRHPRARHRHGSRVCYVRDGCRCSRCTAANTAYEAARSRRTAYGQWQPYIDAEPVRAHVRSLQAQGLGWKRICALARVPHATMTKLLYGDGRRGSAPSRRIRPDTADRLLVVRADLDVLAASAPVDATGTRRRLQALVAIGWSQAKLAARLGMSPSNLGTTMRRTRVRADTARTVRALYAYLWNTQPPGSTQQDKITASRARRHAHARGWAPPMAWDDDRLDDPAARPTGTLFARAGLPHGDELAALLDSDEPTAALATRYGVQPAAIRLARSRMRRRTIQLSAGAA